MLQELTGRSAFVTGAASGIGLAIARELIKAGAKVALADRDAVPLHRAVEDLGPHAFAWPGYTAQ